MATNEKTPLLSETSIDNSLVVENEAGISRLRPYLVTFLLLVALMLERVAYYGIVNNLVMFCTNDLALSSTAGVTINLLFTAAVYFLPLVGGLVADKIAGRFNTIYGSLLTYFLGMAFLPVVAFDYLAAFGYDANGLQYGLPIDIKRGYFLCGLSIIAIGAGCMKSNISPFGAQQVEHLSESAVDSFFIWYYFFVHVGGFISSVFIVYIQQEINFFVGYAIPTISVFVAVIVFAIPRDYYSEHKKGRATVEVIGILWDATARKFRMRKTRNDESLQFLDYAKISNGGKFQDREVNYLRCVLSMIPIFLSLIMFAAVTSQCTTTMLLQGERMDVSFGNIVIPVAFLNTFKMTAILFLSPVLDLIVYPILNYFGKKPSILQRIGFGMVIVSASMVIMGVLEILRKQDLAQNGGIMQMIGMVMYNSSEISILWQTPQFVIIGLGDAFTFTTAMEFAYTESPVIMQGYMMGINHLTTCFGNLLSSALYIITAEATAHAGTPWLPNEINDGHLDSYAFLLAGLLFLNFLIFIILARRYKYCRLGTRRRRIRSPSKDKLTE